MLAARQATCTNGYLFIPLYGPRTDWLKNVLVAGTARLSIGGKELELESPRMVRKVTSSGHRYGAVLSAVMIVSR